MKPSEFIKEDINVFESNGVVQIKECDIGDLLNQLDVFFIDKDDLIKMKIGTCLGLEVFKIQKMIDFFRKEGHNPYEWEEFEKELSIRRFR